ncbi:hypothetical protein JCM8097_001929 [Rhodosporidiobolus ruineniae]
MYPVRAASRLLAPSSSSAQLSLPRLLTRALSTEPTPEPAQKPRNPHVEQRAARTRSLRQVSEAGGATAKLVALAVGNTAQAAEGQQQGQQRHQRRLRPQQQQQGEAVEGEGAVAPRRTFRQRQQTAEVDASLLEGDGAAAPTPSQQVKRPHPRRPQGGSNLGSSLSARRSSLSPEARALRESGAPRFSRGPAGGPGRPGARAGPGGASGPAGARKPRPPMRPKLPRRAPGAGASSIFSAQDTAPLPSPPSVVAVPRANLQQLLRAELAAKQKAVKAAAVGSGLSVDENAAKQADRDAARKVLGGDYSRWVEAGKEVAKGAQGKEQALEQARGVLALNPSVGIAGREALLSKVKEALLQSS